LKVNLCSMERLVCAASSASSVVSWSACDPVAIQRRSNCPGADGKQLCCRVLTGTGGAKAAPHKKKLPTALATGGSSCRVGADGCGWDATCAALKPMVVSCVLSCSVSNCRCGAHSGGSAVGATGGRAVVAVVTGAALAALARVLVLVALARAASPRWSTLRDAHTHDT
jgi:hypothetical protein